MAYKDHFRLVDDVSSHFDEAVTAVDAFLQTRYVGFYSVAAATVIELALKEIIVKFAESHHPIFGGYLGTRYERLNGRIRLKDIRGEHLRPFGGRYEKRFHQLLTRVDRYVVVREKYSVVSAYESLFTCRHSFAHSGIVPASASYSEVKRGFDCGKLVLACLAKTLS